jgi:hypothetical protein
MVSERLLLVVALGWMGIVLLGVGWQITLVSHQVTKAQASLDKITVLVDHAMKPHP